MIGALKSIEPIGFLSFAPASAGTNRADVDRRIIQNCPYGRGAAACAGRPVWFRLRRLREMLSLRFGHSGRHSFSGEPIPNRRQLFHRRAVAVTLRAYFAGEMLEPVCTG